MPLASGRCILLRMEVKIDAVLKFFVNPCDANLHWAISVLVVVWQKVLVRATRNKRLREGLLNDIKADESFVGKYLL